MVFKCFIYGLLHDEWNLFLWCDPGSEMILRKRMLFMDCVQWYIQTSWLWLHCSYLGNFLLKYYLVTPGGGKPYRSRWLCRNGGWEHCMATLQPDVVQKLARYGVWWHSRSKPMWFIHLVDHIYGGHRWAERAMRMYVCVCLWGVVESVCCWCILHMWHLRIDSVRWVVGWYSIVHCILVY